MPQPLWLLPPAQQVKSLPAGAGLTGGGPVDQRRDAAGIPSGTFACWPVRLEVCGVTVNWATLAILTLLEDVLVLTKSDGVPGHLSLPAGTRVSGHPVLERDALRPPSPCPG
ncbi:hypothetical protein AB0I81_20710 [Nonomuraea sp. NPDC050404]|uniref:hypothetical protein n=1 Tax=Nonomuraea sp. NPDC050404 TaxID=3155783 RepID=UPI0033D1C372